MKIDGPSRRRRNLVGITPLVDVVFILLFFFMLASSFDRWHSIDLRLQTSGGQADSPVETRVLSVRPGARIYWLDSWMDLARFSRSLPGLDPSVVLVLKPVQGAAMQDLIDVMEAISSEGHNSVSLEVAAGS